MSPIRRNNMRFAIGLPTTCFHSAEEESEDMYLQYQALCFVLMRFIKWNFSRRGEQLDGPMSTSQSRFKVALAILRYYIFHNTVKD